MDDNIQNNSPKGWTDGELNDWLDNNSPSGRKPDGELTRHTDGRMESKIVGMKITRQRDG